MPLSVDLEADIDENCAEVLRPWTPVSVFFEEDDVDGDALDLPASDFADAHDS